MSNPIVLKRDNYTGSTGHRNNFSGRAGTDGFLGTLGQRQAGWESDNFARRHPPIRVQGHSVLPTCGHAARTERIYPRRRKKTTEYPTAVESTLWGKTVKSPSVTRQLFCPP